MLLPDWHHCNCINFFFTINGIRIPRNSQSVELSSLLSGFYLQVQDTYLVLFQLSKVRQSIIAHSFQSLPRVVNYSDVEAGTHNGSQSEWNKDAPQVNLPKGGNVCKNRNLPRKLTKKKSCSTNCEQLNEKKDKSKFGKLQSYVLKGHFSTSGY